MTFPCSGWKNKVGTIDGICPCGTWKNHWLQSSDKPWPVYCSVYGCVHSPSIGAHVFNPLVSDQQIVPMCTSCNGLDFIFNINADVTPVSASKSKTCS